MAVVMSKGTLWELTVRDLQVLVGWVWASQSNCEELDLYLQTQEKNIETDFTFNVKILGYIFF